MTLVSSMGKPAGFFDPKKPAGEPTRARTPTGRGGRSGLRGTPPAPAAARSRPGSWRGSAPAPRRPPPRRPVLAAGSTSPTPTWRSAAIDVSWATSTASTPTTSRTRASPKLVASVVCPGGQGDVSVYGNLLFMSVEQTRGRIDCGTQGVPTPVSAERFRGVRIFDITDIKQAEAGGRGADLPRLAHPHAGRRRRRTTPNIYVYGSGTGTCARARSSRAAPAGDPKEDPNTALFSIDVIKVPLATPEKARDRQPAAHLRRRRNRRDRRPVAGRRPRPGHADDAASPTSATTSPCIPEVGLAAGACSGNGILLDISDPGAPGAPRPRRRQELRLLAFGDVQQRRHQGDLHRRVGRRHAAALPRHRPAQLGRRRDLRHRRQEADVRAATTSCRRRRPSTENCVAHNGSLDPGARPRHHGAGAGIRAASRCSTSPIRRNPVEIAFFDRGPLDAKKLITGGYWSAYWYNGSIYGAEIARGIDVFKLTPSEFLSQNEIDAAKLVRVEEFNAQKQPKVTWPASFIVAKAYLDQLERARTIAPARAAALRDRPRQRRQAAEAGAGRPRRRWRRSSSRKRRRPRPRTPSVTRPWPKRSGPAWRGSSRTGTTAPVEPTPQKGMT